jgi:hypothetical protein
LPTPITHDPLRVVVTARIGAPVGAPVEALAPIAPAPFTPEGSAPMKVTTVMDAATFCDRLAVTVVPLSGSAEKALHISAVPICEFARWTSCQIRPPPLTDVTVAFGDPVLSVLTKANNNSFAVAVEKLRVVMDVPALDPSPLATASTLRSWAEAILITRNNIGNNSVFIEQSSGLDKQCTEKWLEISPRHTHGWKKKWLLIQFLLRMENR